MFLISIFPNRIVKYSVCLVCRSVCVGRHETSRWNGPIHKIKGNASVLDGKKKKEKGKKKTYYGLS